MTTSDWLSINLTARPYNPGTLVSQELVVLTALFTEYRDRRIKNDSGNYVIGIGGSKMIGAIMLLSKLDKSVWGGG